MHKTPEKQYATKGLTSGSGLPYVASLQKEGQGLLRMIKIRTWQKCPKCQGRFQDTGNQLACPTCCTIPKKFYLEWWYKGERFSLSSFNSYVDAQRKAVTIETEIYNHTFRAEQYLHSREQVSRKYRFMQVYDDWLRGRKREVERNVIAPSYYAKLESCRKDFKGFFGTTDIRTVIKYDIDKFRNSLPVHLSPKTVKNKIMVLRKFLQDMCDAELIAEVPTFDRIQVQQPVPNWIDQDVQLRILSELAESEKPIFMFLFATGLRPAEVRALRWCDVMKDYIHIRAGFSKEIYRPITKTKRQWTIPRLRRINEILSSVPRSLKTDYVFWHGTGKPYTEKRLRSAWYRACAKAGVKGVTMYQGTRHSFASQHVNRGVPLELIGAMMGHTSTRTTRTYARLKKLEALRIIKIYTLKIVSADLQFPAL